MGTIPETARATAPTATTAPAARTGGAAGPGWSEVAPDVVRVEDTCAVYVVRAEPGAGAVGERTGVCVDFGSGRVLDLLPALGLDRITDVVMTHHHRDQGQGLPRAVAAGVRVHVPPVEVELFTAVDRMWEGRQLDNRYLLRDDHLSLLEPVAVTGTVPEYREADYGGVRLRALPTPGHTVGSVSYLLDRGGQRTAFTGDLLYGPGQVWSLASTQWSYTENEGPAMTVLSALLLGDEEPDLLLPSHGRPMPEARAALALLAERMQTYVDSRRPRPWDLRRWLRDPFTPLTEHLLLNRSSLAASYVLLSRTGEALLVDYGYDVTTGLPGAADRAARRPWLASLRALRELYGVRRVSVALPTHYHDDHVAGMPLLRAVEGTEIWAPEHVARVLAEPDDLDLPCRWFDPVVADRRLPLGESFRWNEYTLTVHDLPGHTRYAAAYEVEVDGVRALFTGDQQDGLGEPGVRAEVLNYQYRNRFGLEDYRRSAALYQRVAPGLMLTGHWSPRDVDQAYLDDLSRRGEELVAVHRALLPLDELDLGADSVLARIRPYRSRVRPGGTLGFTLEVRNPLPEAADVDLVPVLPRGWTSPPVPTLRLGPGESADVTWTATASGPPGHHRRVAVDLTIGALRLGQHAEALVDVLDSDAA
ncbi:MBL fold metallo-hydrolase [Microlunatus capsulatus]|uniref:Glyoxylase-like metal-dependent hydrolase (Beta-lactamase superfamily II) n=1 Tax=Microlunatus capsulatus TaxID=99117 RepID=A0ABS4ZC97_9ACTN|nr:MBL fold metallo-hydrolase [Microlunatus capsulatus]MBP2418683.1 glyoxylase-like metal-dependent hydrolase (beta-lactamase superfamily II) [Microlunatus capsulatus]